MKKVMFRVVLALTGLGVAFLGVYWFAPQAGASAAHLPADVHPSGDAVAVACPGRIEGMSDLISVGAAIDGVIQTIHVKEGQQVQEGAVLAEIGCNDLQSSLLTARAELESLKQVRVRLLNGSRPEERQSAAQKTAAAKAIAEQASVQLKRVETLYQSGATARMEFDQARRDDEVAQANLKQAERNEELVDAGPLVEEVERSNADVSAAENRVITAQEKLGKCVVRAPIAGTVLRVHLREGESFALLSPRPLFSMADLSGRRVRAEVDERDVANVHIGQKILVTSDSSKEPIPGTVTTLATMMGRKSVLTGDPADKTDRDVLEVTAKLDPAANKFPVGLRVTIRFLQDNAPVSAKVQTQK